MARFDPNNYSPVQERILQFHRDHPEGSIETFVVSDPNNPHFATVKAEVRPTKEERPVFSDYASEVAGTGIKDGANFGFHVENCATSAIGRALANMGYAKDASDRPSREDMERVNRLHEQAPSTSGSVPAAVTGEQKRVAHPNEPMTDPQGEFLGKLFNRHKIDANEAWTMLMNDEGDILISRADASAWINQMSKANTVPDIFKPLIREG